MNYNKCQTYGACDGRAGVLVDGECLNCHTRKANAIVIHINLVRFEKELQKTFAIISDGEEDIQSQQDYKNSLKHDH